MDLNMNDLYNPEVKGHFFDEYDISDETKVVFYYAFRKASVVEKQLRKDLYEMTDEELEKVLYGAKITSVTTMIAFFSHIKSYITWCADHYGGSNFSVFNGVKFASIAEKYVNKMISSHFTQYDLLQIYERFLNKSDMAIIQATFEGIRGEKRSELRNMKLDDITKKDDKYFINLYDTELGTERLEHEISKTLYDLLVQANNETRYENDKGNIQDLKPSEYILKRSVRGRQSEPDAPIEVSVVHTRTINYKKIFAPDRFNLKDIESSGIMEYLYEMIKDQPEEVKEVRFEHLIKISDRYNIGKYIHSTTLSETVSYSVIRNRINKKFFEDNYCKFEFVKR